MLSAVRAMPAFGGFELKSVPVFLSNRRDQLTYSVLGRKAGGTYTMTSIGKGLAATLNDVATADGASDGVAVADEAVDFTASDDKGERLTLSAAPSDRTRRYTDDHF